MHDNKHIKTKIKIFNNRINADFNSNKIQEDNECFACLFVILLDYVVVVDKKYYPEIYLEEFKYAVKKKKIINSFNEELSLNECSDESDNDED